MPPEIKFGAWSVALLLPTAQALIVAVLLLIRRDKASAHRWIALLLIVLAGMLIPYGIGYAGFYDRWRWLTYAPFAVPLAVGPLVYAHVVALVEARRISRRHWIAPLLQFGYQAALFPFPLAIKEAFNTNVDTPWIAPVLDIALFVLLALYLALTIRLLRRYRQWIVPRRANMAPLVRLRTPLAALLAFFLLWSGYTFLDRLVRPLGYFDEFPTYVALALLTVWLTFAAWRHADHSFPVMAQTDTTDWVARGQAWHAELLASDWWRDSNLDAGALARRLGTNTNHLSRAFNAGLGQSLPQILNEIRCKAVQDAMIADPDREFLSAALDAGFGSKASFNRAFKAQCGATPTEWLAARRNS